MKKLARLVLISAGLLTACGDDAERAAAPAQVTPVPTAEAPVPTPEAELHEEPGDEAGIRVPVTVEVGPDAVSVEPPVVAAFLPLGLTIRNEREEDVTAVVLRGDDDLVRVEVGAGESATADVRGMKAGTLEIRAGGASATLRVEPGG